MKNTRKAAFLCLAATVFLLFSCQKRQEKAAEKVTITVAAAASLEKAFTGDLIPLFTQKNPGIQVEGVYDSSGKLQTQIEQGLGADVFVSAAQKQMDALVSGGFIKNESVKPLLQNRLALIKPKGVETAVADFATIGAAKTQIAVGDPQSVPAGQYAKEALTTLGVWDSVEGRLSLGSNVTETLNWVAQASAEVGIVYATDAASSANVEVIALLPDGILSAPVIYPAAVVAASAKPAEAAAFAAFLGSPEALAIFEKYGFSSAK
ncbi:MAG: molybdate ABC transporter substrate-binding protein [Spirochaetaceae bacterium]|jgi:molybdate transport system substrate-binding protein|nr:molybdate ABC transporter substrate-binding protein [Spirochaetaceae bacterium]